MSGLCECGSSETVKHIFLECRKYRTERRILFDRLLGVEAFSVFSLFGHCENHKLISKAIPEHRTVCKNRVRHRTCGGQYYAKQRLNCRNSIRRRRKRRRRRRRRAFCAVSAKCHPTAPRLAEINATEDWTHYRTVAWDGPEFIKYIKFGFC